MLKGTAGRRVVDRPSSAGVWPRSLLVLALALWPAIASAQAGTITTFAGSGLPDFGFAGDQGPATQAILIGPLGLAVGAFGDFFIAETSGNRIRRVGSSGIITTFVGTGIAGFNGDGGQANQAQLNGPRGILFDRAGNLLIAESSANRVRRIATDGTISTIAGPGPIGSFVGPFGGDGGPATQANLNAPTDLALDSSGNIFFTDQRNRRVRKISPAGIITTVAGSGFGGSTGDGGPATDASFDTPVGLAVDAGGNLYISDATSHRVRRVFAGGFTQTFAGTGVADFTGDGGAATSAALNTPQGLTLDAAGNLYIADARNHRIRKVTPGLTISTIAGTGTPGFAGDDGPAVQAQLNFPAALTFDPAGNLFVADLQNRRVRKIALVGPPALSADMTSVAVGAQITFRVGGTPRQPAVIAYSRANSGAGSVQGQTLLLGSDAQVLTSGTVDQSGTFAFRLSVPRGVPAGTYYLQGGVADDAAFTTNLRLTTGIAVTIRAAPLERGLLTIVGTTRYLDVEGGCWQFRSDAGGSYELIGELARQLRVEGRRAEITIRPRSDMVSICQSGTIAEVVDIR